MQLDKTAVEHLTDRQQQILGFVRSHLEQQGRPPTRAEIAHAFGFRSANAAEEHLRALARKGVLNLDAGTARGISLPGASSATGAPRGLRLPVLGQVAAGAPILAQEHIEREIDVDPALFQPRADFLLRVRGESMRDAGIVDGDLLAVTRTSVVRHGEIAVVRIDEEVTVKYFDRDAGGNIVLRAANPAFAAIVVRDDGRNVQIEGRAVGVLRTSLGRG